MLWDAVFSAVLVEVVSIVCRDVCICTCLLISSNAQLELQANE